MPSGGKRPGAGRPKGSISTTRKLRDRAEKSGLHMPADILLNIANYHFERALVLRAKKPRKAEEKLAIVNEIRVEHGMGMTAADKAAPFYHPRLAALAGMRPPDPGATSLEQMILASMASIANQNAPALPPPAAEQPDDGVDSFTAAVIAAAE